MFTQVLKLLRLPMLLLVVFTIGRFYLGFREVPYAPRGSSIFSIVVLNAISCIYFGALSGKIMRMPWQATLMIGLILALFSQVLVLSATIISYEAQIKTSYFLHWDALNIPEGKILTLGEIIGIRVRGLLIGAPITSIITSFIGRGLGSLLLPSLEKKP